MVNQLEKLEENIFSVRRLGIELEAPTGQDQSTVAVLVKVVYDMT